VAQKAINEKKGFSALSLSQGYFVGNDNARETLIKTRIDIYRTDQAQMLELSPIYSYLVFNW
jgi:hypothetical protein